MKSNFLKRGEGARKQVGETFTPNFKSFNFPHSINNLNHSGLLMLDKASFLSFLLLDSFTNHARDATKFLRTFLCTWRRRILVVLVKRMFVLKHRTSFRSLKERISADFLFKWKTSNWEINVLVVSDGTESLSTI